MSDTNDMSAVLTELAATRAALTDTVSKMRRRNQITTVLSVLSIVILGVYLSYGYKRYGGDVTPDLVAAAASQRVQEQLPSASAALEKDLKDRAPKVVADAFHKLTEMPDVYARRLQDEAVTRMDAAMPEVQDKVYTSMKSALDTTVKATAASAGPGAKDDEARLKATLAAIADVYAADTMRFVDQTHATYWSDAGTFLTYMDRLATSPNLDRRDRLHRDMFSTMFAIVRERANKPTPGQGSVDLSILKGKP